MAGNGYWQPNVTTYGGGANDQGAGYQAKKKPIPGYDSYKPSGYSPWGPTSGPGAYPTTQSPTPAQQPQAPKQGVLSTPGQYEQFYDRFKNDPNRGYFQPRQKSYTEELYESGNQGLNKYYQQARGEGEAAIRAQMGAMGVLGSSATGDALSSMNSRLGAQYGRDMAGLASAADTSGSNRLSDYWSGQKNEGDLADRAQTHFQNRERLPLQDKTALASQMAPMFERFSSASTNEQREIFEQIVQAGITSGAVDRQSADQWAEDMFRMYGIGIRAADLRNNPTSTSTVAQTGRPYAVG